MSTRMRPARAALATINTRALAELTALATLAELAACADGPDQRLAIVDAPRVLAIVAEPAEARPGAAVTYRALVGSPEGTLAAAPRWSYCTAPKPPTEDNVVSASCAAGDALSPLGEAPAVTAALPADACTRFGPEVPPGDFRPRDPDPTGGFYQPVRADALALVAFGLSRITCKLANTTADVAREYELSYVANQNPTLELPGEAALAVVPAHADVPLVAAWPAAAAETYLYFDPLAQALVTRREAMRVSWFSTGGALDVDASAVGEDDPATSVAATWRTPGPGAATLWFVLRDSRGGVATRAVSVLVLVE
ncbi:MAG TPA: hypothetical protein VNO30_47860 [Kofleriaceae bacterium]|nr:hypothetical protein [Kofleriaceae bacterium]